MHAFRTSLPLAGAFALGMAANPAQAADLYAPVPAANWAGFYAGSIIGYGWTDAEASLAGAPGVTGSETVDGATGGGVLGYNWQSGNWVFGVEGDLTLHEIRGEVPVAGFGLGSVDVDTLWSGHVRGRVGYDLGRFLPYVAGGFTANETYVRISASPLNGANERMFGWNLGAGVDWKLGETFIGPVIVRAEYLYESVSSELYDVAADFDVEHATHFVRLGLISYLGDDGAPAAVSGEAADWSGAYGGLIAGFGKMDVSNGPPGDTDADGGLGGIYLGRNFQFGQIVAGFESSVLLTDISGNGPTNLGATEFRSYVQGDARLRLGYAAGEFLPFIAGGVAWTRSEQFGGAGGPPQEGRVPALFWTVGAGLDYRVTDRISLRGEYMYGEAFDASSPDWFSAGIEQDIDFHQVRFGTAYHF